MSTRPPLPNYEDALMAILAAAPQLGAEPVSLDNAVGRVLAEAVHADRDQPPFNRSAMDGYAIRAADIKPGVALRNLGVVPAGADESVWRAGIPAGCTRRIATGAPVPPDADAVVPIELTKYEGRGDAEGDMIRFTIDAVDAGMSVHPQGADAKTGGVVLQAGAVLGPAQIGLAAGMGHVTVQVRCRPRVTILTTGDEVVSPATATADLLPQQIRNSNGPMLAAMVNLMGGQLLAHVHVPDDPEETTAAAREALSHSHVVLTTGGVSVGDRDHLPRTWAKLGLETIVHGVAIQPGKPVLAATLDNKLVLGLPGNPVSVLTTAHLFAWPVFRRMLGIGVDSGVGAATGDVTHLPPWRPTRLSEPTTAKAARELFRAATIEPDGRARVIAWHGSGDLAHTSVATGFVRLPQVDRDITVDEPVMFLPML